MRAGTVFRRFTAQDGREVTLRAPKWSDLDDMLEFINSLVEEEAPIAVNQKISREDEVDWLSNQLSRLEKDNAVVVVAEVKDKFVGQVEVTPRVGRLSHVGDLGISLKDGYRGVGIGSELIKEAEAQALRLGIKTLTLQVFGVNDRAIRVYEKTGFREVGRIHKGALYKGEYIDTVTMAKGLAA